VCYDILSNDEKSRRQKQQTLREKGKSFGRICPHYICSRDNSSYLLSERERENLFIQISVRISSHQRYAFVLLSFNSFFAFVSHSFVATFSLILFFLAGASLESLSCLYDSMALTALTAA